MVKRFYVFLGAERRGIELFRRRRRLCVVVYDGNRRMPRFAVVVVFFRKQIRLPQLYPGFFASPVVFRHVSLPVVGLTSCRETSRSSGSIRRTRESLSTKYCLSIQAASQNACLRIARTRSFRYGPATGFFLSCSPCMFHICRTIQFLCRCIR